MKKLLLIFGFLWILYGIVGLSMRMSIKSAPDDFILFNYLNYYLILLQLFAGILFIYGYINFNKRQKKRLLEKTFTNLMKNNKLKMAPLQLSLKSSIDYQECIEFIDAKIKKENSKFRYDKSGNVLYYNPNSVR